MACHPSLWDCVLHYPSLPLRLREDSVGIAVRTAGAFAALGVKLPPAPLLEPCSFERCVASSAAFSLEAVAPWPSTTKQAPFGLSLEQLFIALRFCSPFDLS